MMVKRNKSNIHVISLLVANKPGVLVRCAQVFARRGFNIDALVVSPSVNPKYSRMTITASGDPETLDQIIKQTDKLIDVVHAAEHTGLDAVSREMALIKVKVTPANRDRLVELLENRHAKVVEESGDVFIIEYSAHSNDLDVLENLLKKFGIIEMVRSGKLVMAKGHEET